jgi:hypothetical protein
VTSFLSKKAQNHEDQEGKESTENQIDSLTSFHYNYEMWLSHVKKFQTVSQKFYQFSKKEYLWNRLDSMIIGNLPYEFSIVDDLKPRYVHFIIIPKNITSEQEMNEYYSKIDSLMEIVAKYAWNKDEDIIKIQKDTQLLRYANPLSTEAPLADFIYSNSFPPPPTVAKDSVLSNPLMDYWVNKPIYYYKRTSSDMNVIKCQMRARDQGNPNWLYFKYDKNIYSYKAFHIDMQWLVCDSWLVDDFVTLLYRRCGRFGLRLIQTPGYFNSDNLNIHPYRPAPYIFIPQPNPIMSNTMTASSYNLLQSANSNPTAGGGGGGSSNNLTASAIPLSSASPPPSYYYYQIPFIHSSALRLLERLYFIHSPDWIFDGEEITKWDLVGLTTPNYFDRDRDILYDEILYPNNVPPASSSLPPKAPSALMTTTNTRSNLELLAPRPVVGSSITKSLSRMIYRSKSGEDEVALGGGGTATPELLAAMGGGGGGVPTPTTLSSTATTLHSTDSTGRLIRADSTTTLPLGGGGSGSQHNVLLPTVNTGGGNTPLATTVVVGAGGGANNPTNPSNPGIMLERSSSHNLISPGLGSAIGGPYHMTTTSGTTSSLTPTASAALGSGTTTTSGKADYHSKAWNKRVDRQYLHVLGIATVRMGPNGFLWFASSTTKLSDINMSVDEKTIISMKALKQLELYCNIVNDVYEILLEVVDKAFTTADCKEIVVELVDNLELEKLKLQQREQLIFQQPSQSQLQLQNRFDTPTPPPMIERVPPLISGSGTGPNSPHSTPNTVFYGRHTPGQQPSTPGTPQRGVLGGGSSMNNIFSESSISNLGSPGGGGGGGGGGSQYQKALKLDMDLIHSSTSSRDSVQVQFQPTIPSITDAVNSVRSYTSSHNNTPGKIDSPQLQQQPHPHHHHQLSLRKGSKLESSSSSSSDDEEDAGKNLQVIYSRDSNDDQKGQTRTSTNTTVNNNISTASSPNTNNTGNTNLSSVGRRLP